MCMYALPALLLLVVSGTELSQSERKLDGDDQNEGTPPSFASSSRGIFSKKPPDFELYVLGDTHGSLPFLCQALMATGKFTLPTKRVTAEDFAGLQWDPEAGNDFKVVIVGDVLDRGHQDQQMLRMIRTLTQHPVHGHQLQLLIGNHEEMMLQHDFRYAPDFDLKGVQGAARAAIGSRNPKDKDVVRRYTYETPEKPVGRQTAVSSYEMTQESLAIAKTFAVDDLRYFNTSFTVFDREAGFVSPSVSAAPLAARVAAMNKVLQGKLDDEDMDDKTYSKIASRAAAMGIHNLAVKELVEAPDLDRAKESRDLVDWVRTLDVITIVTSPSGGKGVLLAHAGLQNSVLQDVKKSAEGAEPVEWINKEAQKYYAEMVHSYERAQRKAEELKDCQDEGCELADAAISEFYEVVGKRPVFLGQGSDVDGGVTWFRGYTRKVSGAGSDAKCADAGEVAQQLNLDTMVLGHTSHEYITHYCHSAAAPAPNVYAVDTHEAFSCFDGECDVEPQSQGWMEHFKKKPTMLRIQWFGENKRTMACKWVLDQKKWGIFDAKSHPGIIECEGGSVGIAMVPPLAAPAPPVPVPEIAASLRHEPSAESKGFFKHRAPLPAAGGGGDSNTLFSADSMRSVVASEGGLYAHDQKQRAIGTDCGEWVNKPNTYTDKKFSLNCFLGSCGMLTVDQCKTSCNNEPRCSGFIFLASYGDVCMFKGGFTKDDVAALAVGSDLPGSDLWLKRSVVPECNTGVDHSSVIGVVDRLVDSGGNRLFSEGLLSEWNLGVASEWL